MTQTGDTNKESKLLEGDYKFLFDNSPISIALLDLKGNIVEINPATHSMMALKRSQIIGKHFSDIYIIPPENLDEMISAFKDILDGRIYGPKEIRIVGKDNKITWVNVTGSLVKIKNTPFIQILTQDVSSRKELENKLEESELRYRRLYENSPFSLVLLNRKGIIINCNSTTEKIYGYKKEEVIGKDFLVLNIYSDEQIKLLIKRYKELREGKTLKPLELQIKRKDGTLIWVSQLTTLNKVGGEILIETITQDISERKIAEQKLSESEEKYRIFTENSNDLIVVVDSKLKTKFINEGVHTRLMGYRRDDVIGKNGLDFIHPDDQEEVFEAFSKLRDEGSGSVESRIKHKKGHYIWTETTGSMFKGKDNKLNFILNARIIEERKKAEQTLKESRKRYIELANSLPEVIFEIDLNYRLTYTNSIASEVFGYSNEDFKKGLYAHQFLHPDEKEEVFDNLAKLFTGKRVAPQIMRLRRKDESYFYANVITIPTYENGKVVGIRSIIHDVTEIKEAQEKIKESEEQFRTIAEQSLMGICIIQDNVVKYLNKTLADLLGFAVEDILEWKQGEFFKTIHPKDKRRVIELATKADDAFEEGIRFYEARGLNRHQEVFWVEVYYKKIQYQHRSAYLIFFINITEKKKAQDKLRESEKRYRLITENANDVISMLDQNLNLIYINEISQKIFGFTKEDVLGKSPLDFIHPEDIKKVRMIFQDIRKIGEGSGEFRMKTKRGNYIWMESRIRTIIDKDENLSYLLVSREITKRKLAEQKLKESEERYRYLFEKSPFSILLIDTSGRIVDCNPALTNLVGYEEKELIGKQYMRLPIVSPEYLPLLLKRLKKISVGEPIPPVEIEMKKKDGTLIWTSIESSLVKRGDNTFIIVMGSDITAKKQAEQEISRLNTIRKKFMETAAHELKTPVTTVYGANQLIYNSVKDDYSKDELELFQIAFSGAIRLKKLVANLLDFSAIESKQFTLNKSEINLSEVVENCVKEMDYQLKGKNFEVRLDLIPYLYLEVDKDRIETVVFNLISNSIKYTPSKGVITVSLKKKGKYAELKVKDTGMGLDERDINKLFKKFSRIRDTIEEANGVSIQGTGLGLYITKEIVQQHDGKIFAESEGRNKGSTFTVQFPLN